MYTLEQILTVARTVRSQLPELLSAEVAAQVDWELSTLIDQAAAGHPVGNQILAVISRYDALRDRASTLLSSDNDSDPISKGYNSLPGNIDDISAPRFKCPQCDYVWHRPRSGIEPPQCPTHNVILERIA